MMMRQRSLSPHPLAHAHWQSLLLAMSVLLLLLPTAAQLSAADAGADGNTETETDTDTDTDIPEFIAGRVVKVHDGDTITVLAAGRVQYKVRLFGIDAPEAGQPFSRAAKETLSNAIADRSVTIQTTGRDRYGRLLGHVLYNRRNVNFDMIAWGMAWHYARYFDEERFAEAQRAAWHARRGLWQQREQAIPPWEWRHSHSHFKKGR